MELEDNGFWWRVKVFDVESGTYTWLDKYAMTAQEAEDSVDPNDWTVCRGKTYKSEYQ